MIVNICGHSHLAAIKDGSGPVEKPSTALDASLSSRFVPLPGAEYTPKNFSVVEPKGVRLTRPRYIENFEKYTGDSHIGQDQLWGFCMAGYPFRLDGGALWRRFRPAPLWEPEKRPISLAQLDAIMDTDTRATLNFFDHCQQAKVNFFVIALPSSVRNFHPDDEESDVITRAFIQNRSRARFRSQLKARGIDYIDVPPGLQDKDGFMDPQYMRMVKPNGAKDFNHGNAKYGALMLGQIFEYANRHAQTKANG